MRGKNDSLLVKLGYDPLKRWRLARKHGYGTSRNLLNKVEVEIITACNLHCHNCDRSCRQAPSGERMSPAQLRGFVDESLEVGWEWDRINLLGGEPTLHPELPEIFEEVRRYKVERPECVVQLTSNGHGELVRAKLDSVPDWVEICNTSKDSPEQYFASYNIAPADYGFDQPPVCAIPWRCGLGLTRYGYYPCGAGASLDRIFGMDIGVKSLRDVDLTKLLEQFGKLCAFCGHSPTKVKRRVIADAMSPSWERSYAAYHENAPALSLVYCD
jgi:hypothetical protein